MVSMRSRSHPSFEPLAVPAMLRVPATLRSETPSTRPIGTRVGAGERLTESAAQADHWPLAPVAGEIVGEAEATLTSGRLVRAIELRPIDPASESVPLFAASAAAAPSDSDRGGWIDRLRAAGVWADRWGSPN